MLTTLVLATSAAPPAVQLECGTKIQGYHIPAFDVNAFEGIPFAEEPLGRLRWAAPQDLDCRDDVIDATAPASECPQAPSPGMGVDKTTINTIYFIIGSMGLSVPLVLLVLALIFGLCAWREARKFDNTQYADLEERGAAAPAALPAWTSSWCFRGCALAALLPLLLMLTLPGWAWTNVVGDEDCLYLNVYAPASAMTAAEPLAVMVFIHGGAHQAGTGRLDDPQYGSSLELPMEGIIHVNIQYRLGVFGFLCLDDGETVPNAGLLDQISALRWVNRHIASFNGDPSRVLLYGHSAGGSSVTALQRMPAAKGLFHAAAAMSPLPKLGATPQAAAKQWATALEPLGCGVDVACLRALPANTLAAWDFMGTDPESMPDFGTMPTPTKAKHSLVAMIVADERSTAGEWAMLPDERWAVDVPFLFVGCREQGDFGDVPDLYTPYGLTAPVWPLTQESFTGWAVEAGIASDDAASVYSLYSGAETPRQRWMQIGADVTLFCGLRATAKSEHAAGRSSPLYLVIFSKAVPNTAWGPTLYAMEGIDIYLAWGRTAAEDVLLREVPEDALASGKAMRESLVGLARKATLGDEWQPYPAVCEMEDALECSAKNAHAQACDVFDTAFGREYDTEMG